MRGPGSGERNSGAVKTEIILKETEKNQTEVEKTNRYFPL